jgi:hypothetical protein
MCCGLINAVDLCNDSPEAEDSSEVKEEGALVPQKQLQAHNFKQPITTHVLFLLFFFQNKVNYGATMTG